MESGSGSVSVVLTHNPGGRLEQTASGGSATEFLCSGIALLAEYNRAGSLPPRFVRGSMVDVHWAMVE
jgi:hypothetical protein